jgi:ribonuclease P protein subunit POP4
MNNNFITKEFIGKTIYVQNSKNKNYIGINGIIIDETKNTFTIISKKKKKIILKNCAEFIFSKNNNKKINGNKILKRPEERIKIR